MDMDIPMSLYEKALGKQVLNYAEGLKPDELLAAVQSEALELLCEIKAILDDDSAGDPECFFRIEALVKAFEEKGLQTRRHDW